MESLSALFEAHKPLKPQFKAVEVVKVKKSDEKNAEEGEGNSSTPQKPRRFQPGATKVTAKLKPDPRESRTVFVGNIPVSYSRKKIKQLFKEYGAVESVRLRSIAVSPGDLPAKVARRTFKQVSGSSLNAYVVLTQEDEAERCLALNGALVGGRHIRVDLAAKPKLKAATATTSHCVFLGNLPFTVDEEQIRESFRSCGEIDSVRVVRDSKTNIGKGFGYVNFKEKSGVIFALKQNKKVEIEGRSVRVFKCKDMASMKKVSSKTISKPKFAGLQAENPGMKRKDKPRWDSERRAMARAPKKGDFKYDGHHGDRGRGARGRSSGRGKPL